MLASQATNGSISNCVDPQALFKLLVFSKLRETNQTKDEFQMNPNAVKSRMGPNFLVLDIAAYNMHKLVQRDPYG